MLTREATGIWPMSKKSRHLVLAVASGCTLGELFSTLPLFLIGRMIWKHLLFVDSYFTLFPSFYILLDVITCLFYLINDIDYSVELSF